MIKKIDIESEEFQTELELTKQYTDKVCEKYNFVYNPENDVNESIQLGLTRNKIIYGKRYCPCFMVIGKTQEERDKEDNRLCPCTPALNEEIPSLGHCHCAIFCTPEYVNQNTQEELVEEKNQHSLGLSKKQCEDLLKKDQINAKELEALLEARKLGYLDFLLVDTREWMEWVGSRIEGTDYLIPTTSFYQALEQIEDKKETPIIVYCHSGSRSAYCQKVMLNSDYKNVINLDHGIMTYQGDIISGE